MSAAGSPGSSHCLGAKPTERHARRPSLAAMSTSTPVAHGSGTFEIGGDLTVHRLGYGAMQLPGKGVWGPTANHDESIAVLRRAVELGVDLIDTADAYGPEIADEL